MANPLFGHYPYTVRGTVARTRRQHLPLRLGSCYPEFIGDTAALRLNSGLQI
jgi:hypothetical protein